MNCDADMLRAEAILEAVMAALGEDSLAGAIDGPVDAVTDQMFGELLSDPDGNSLHDVVTRFMVAVHARGIPCARTLTEADALARGVALVAGHYDAPGVGWQLALADLGDGGVDALQAVVICLGKAVKITERGATINWVLARHIRHISWEERCSVTRAYLACFGDALPARLAALPLGALSEMLEDLILIHVQAEHVVSEAASQFAPPASWI